MAQEMILSSSSKKKADRAHSSEGEEERDKGSLVRKPRARRRVISDDEATPPSSVPSTAPTITTSHVEVGSSSNSRVVKKITIEVPEDGNLLKKYGQADVWLKPLIGPVEKSKLESHSSLTWMNDIVHSSLKINLIGTKMMKRIIYTEQLMNDYHTEADN
nr:uncharacterized protein LOC117276794 [Nicotiana tomentosiformis]